MSDDEYLRDPIEEVARKFRVFWEYVKQTFFEASRGERLTVLTNLLTAFLTFALVIIGAIAGAIYWGQLKATQRQLVVMQTQLESADRPWLKVTGAVPSHPMVFHTAGSIQVPGNDFVNTGIKVTVENVGHSVALDVTTRAQMVLVSMTKGAENYVLASPLQDSYPFKMQKKLCSEAARPTLPINLFPGDSNNDQNGDDEDMALSGKTFAIPGDVASQKILVYFVGCVDYRISTSGKTHRSDFIYELMGIDPTQRNVNGLFTVGTDLPITNLRLEKWGFGGFGAN
jgi:hypothetical protein